ncbi:MAG: FMN-binding protein [Acidimicrobiales bacterium]
MNRASLLITGSVIGIVGLLGYRAVLPSSPTFAVVPSAAPSTAPSAPRSTTTTTAAPPPTTSTTAPPARTTTPTTSSSPSTTAPTTTTTPSTTTTVPATTTTVPATTTTAPATIRSASGDSVNYIYGVLSVKVTASGSKLSKVTIASINDGGNYRSQSIDQASIPLLEQQALSAQSANIQGVSGASYTSAGFRQSLQSALTKLGL